MNNSENKLVSVIVPVYKVEKDWLNKCVDSIIAQTYENLEIILVDDGNDEQYKEFLFTIKEKSEKISIVSHDNNKGLYKARLTGVERASGDYLAFVDADDYIGIDWIRLLVNKALASKADIVMGQTICEDSNHWRYIYNSNYSICNQKDKTGEEIFAYIMKDCGLDFSIHTVWNKLYSKSLWEKSMKDLKCIDKHLVMTEDIMFSMTLFFHANRMAFSAHDGYFYYRNEKSSTIGKNDYNKCKKNIEDIECVFDTLMQFMINHNIYDKYKDFFNEWKNRYYRWWSYTVESVCKSIEEDQAKDLKEYFFKVFDKETFEYAKEVDSYFDQKKTEWNPKLEKIKETIASEEIKVVSFDLFDTLITRPVLYPEDVYYIVANDVDLDTYDLENIIRYRRLGEEYARKLNAVKHPNYEDVTLTEIYDSMCNYYGVNKDLCAKLKSHEEDVEVEFANRRNTGYELYNLAISLGKKIYITSDMYLEKQVIERILLKNGYNYYEQILLSSEKRALKTTGKLFEHLIQSTCVDPAEIMHIGDNWNVDYLMAARKGIKSVFIPKTKDILLNYLGDAYTGNAYGEALNNANSVVDKSKFFNSLSNRCLTAVAANLMFDNPFISINKVGDYNGNPYQFGAMALGQHMLGISLWLKNMAEKNDSKMVHFSSRDGYYIKNIFDYLIKECGDDIQTNYLHISRKAFIPIEIKSKNDIKNIINNCSLYANSPKTIIDRYNKVLADMDNDIIKKYMDAGIDLDKKFDNEDEFIRFLTALGDIQFSEEKAKKQFLLCKDYLMSAINNENDIVFDLGYSGKLHNDIVKCTGTNIIGAYVSKDGYNALKRIDENGLKIESYYSFIPSMQGIINEYIFSDRGPSCIGYEEKNNNINVEFETKMLDYIGDYVINEINRGAYDYVKMFVSSFRNRLDIIKLMPMDASLLYEHFLVNPKPFDRAIFDYCLIEDEYYGGINERKLTEIWDWQLHDRGVYFKQNLPKQDVKVVERVIEKVPDNLVWEVYKEELMDRNLLSKALYWMSTDKTFFKKRLKDYMNGKRVN